MPILTNERWHGSYVHSFKDETTKQTHIFRIKEPI